MAKQRTGQYFGRYQIIRRLGRGGMAEVYQAVDTSLGRNVAIKIISQHQEDPVKFYKRFKREAWALAQLSHPHILKILDFGEQDGLPFLVMEYMEGGTLSGMAKPMHYQRAARLLLPIADALHYAHRQGIIHRDVKPSNILLNHNGQPILADFGIAKLLDPDESIELTVNAIGTPGYMSPEQGQGQKVDARTDIYALGVVFYELVTGVRPYKADTPMSVLHKQLTEPFINPRSLVPSLPKGVANCITKELAREPHKRQASMAEVARELELFAKSDPGKLARRVLGLPLRWIGLIIFLLLMGGLLTGLLWNLAGKTAGIPTPSPERVTATGSVAPINTKTATVPPQNTLKPTTLPTSTRIPTQTPILGTIPITVDNVKNIKLITEWDYDNDNENRYFDNILFSPDSQSLVFTNKEYKPDLIYTSSWVFKKGYLIQRNILDGKIADSREIYLDLYGLTFKGNQLLGLAKADFGQPLIMWSFPDQNKLLTFQNSLYNITDPIFSRDHSLLVANNWNGVGNYGNSVIKGWDTTSGKVLFTITKYPDANSSIGISPDNNLLAWIRFGTARVFSIPTRQFLYAIDGLDRPEDHAKFISVASQNNVFFSLDGKLLVLSGWDGVQVLSTSDGSLIHRLKRAGIDSSNCRIFAFSPDSHLLVEYADSSIALWDVQTGGLIKVLTTPAQLGCNNYRRDGILFSPNGAFLLLSSSSKILVWGISP